MSTYIATQNFGYPLLDEVVPGSDAANSRSDNGLGAAVLRLCLQNGAYGNGGFGAGRDQKIGGSHGNPWSHLR